jgi:cytochrome c5
VKLFLIAALALAASAQDQLPEGDGKKEVEKVCNDCHGTETYTQKKRTKDQWEKVVQSMIDKGAEGTDAEFDKIIAYLTKNFGKSE